MLLKVLGGIWAAIGLGDIVMNPVFRHTGNGGMAVVVVLFNFLVFIFPGLGLYALGTMILRKRSRQAQGTAMETAGFCPACGNPTPRNFAFCRNCGQKLAKGAAMV
jgi:hypothetical protein